jgi:hypothetical protein
MVKSTIFSIVKPHFFEKKTAFLSKITAWHQELLLDGNSLGDAGLRRWTLGTRGARDGEFM